MSPRPSTGSDSSGVEARPEAPRRVLRGSWTRLAALLRPRDAAPEASAPEPSGDPIRYKVESLEAGTFLTRNSVPVSGWACAEAGIAAIEIYIGGELVEQLDTGLARPDVAAAFPSLADAERSGFSGVVDLRGKPAGDHPLTVLIRDAAERTVRFERTVRLVPPPEDASGAEGEAPESPADPIHHHLDVPGRSASLTAGPVQVSGWACAEAGIAAVEVYLGDELLERLETGLARPDVGDAYPEIAEAARSGFSGSLNLLGRRCGNHQLSVVIRDNAERTVRVERTVRLVEHEMLYQRYFLASLPTPEEEQRLLEQCGARDGAVRFELWLEVEGPDTGGATDTIRSIVGQAYPHWRLYLLPRAGSAVEWPREEERIALGSFEALEREEVTSSPAYLAFLRAGEVLAPGALSRAAAWLTSHPQTELLYSDHDRIKPGGLHASPSFKPDWSPDHLLSRDYVGGVFFLRGSMKNRDLGRQLMEAGDRAWRYDLLLRISDGPAAIAHLPEVLWSHPPGREVAAEGEMAAARAAVERRRWSAEVAGTETPGVRRVRWHAPRQPKVSIVIPTTGNQRLLRGCVESLLESTRYPSYELLFIDNGRGRHPEGIAHLRSRGLQVLERDEPFNWARLNNAGARASRGELLLFLNDDIEVVDPEWLDELVSLACREEIGCVGAMLVYPDDRIQHAGVFLVNHGGGARHFLRGEQRTGAAYESLHQVVREVTCNTGACLMIRRDLFERLGGFDESLEIVGNDIDLCLRARAAGFRNLWTPHCRLVHHESASRQEINILDDEGRMRERWGELLRAGDPYYNPNLSPHTGDGALNLERLRERERPDRARPVRTAPVPGLNLIGYIKAEMGIGEGMRGLAAACAAAGVPFDIYNYEHHNPARMGDERWSSRITHAPSQPINLLQVNADLIASARSALPAAIREGRYTIAHWVWELPEFPDARAEAFRFLDEVWTPSGFVQEAVALKSPVPVVRIPYVVEKREQSYLGRHFFSLPERAFLFLMMYDVHSIRERKNPGGAIAAFEQAFARDDTEVGLVIKINNCTESERACVAALIADHPNIHVVDATLSRYEVDSLIHSCDAFLSLHRAEGFGLAIAEAMALGRPAIATHWSGNTDFMSPSNSACVDYRLIQLDRDHGPYAKGQWWADPDLEHAAWWMRKLRSDSELRKRIAARGMADVADLLSARRVGTLIASRLRHVRSK